MTLGIDFKKALEEIEYLKSVSPALQNDIARRLDLADNFLTFGKPAVENHLGNRNNPHLVRGSQILPEPNGDYILGGSGYHFYYDATNDQATIRLASQTMLQLTAASVELNPYGYDADFSVDGITNTYIFGDATLQRVAIGNGSPSDTLHVFGTFRSTDQAVFQSNVYHYNNQAVYWADSFGADLSILKLDSSDIFNIGSASTGIDVRITGGSESNMIYLDASANRVGIGTNTPDGPLHVYSGSAGSVTANVAGDEFVIEGSTTTTGMSFLSPSGNQYILFGDPASNAIGQIYYSHTSNSMTFVTNALSAMVLTSSQGTSFFGNLTVAANNKAIQFTSTAPAYVEFVRLNTSNIVVFNNSALDMDYQFKGVADANLIYLDTGNDRVGIGTATPAQKLDINGAVNVGGALYMPNATSVYFKNSTGTSYQWLQFDSGNIFNINPAGAAYNVRVQGNTNANLLYIDTTNHRVGINTAPGVELDMYNDSGNARPILRFNHVYDSQYGPFIQFQHERATGQTAANNDVPGSFQWKAYDATATPVLQSFNQMDAQVISTGSGYVEGQFRFWSMDTGGTLQRVGYWKQGLAVGSPTGGDKGLGTINVATNIYKNNTAYTNPDYVLEHWATGEIKRFADKPGAKEYVPMTLAEIEDHILKNLRLPGITDEPAGIFDMADTALELIERLYCYIIDLNNKVDSLSRRLETDD